MRARFALPHFKTDQAGTSLVELALLLPVLCTIGFGAIEFGRLLYVQQLIIWGVRDGARYAAGLPYDGNSASTQSVDTINKATYIAACGKVVATDCDEAGEYRLSWWAPSAVTVTYSANGNVSGTNCGSGSPSGAACLRGGDQIYTVTVSTSIAYPSAGFLEFLYNRGAIGTTTWTIAASQQERVYHVR